MVKVEEVSDGKPSIALSSTAEEKPFTLPFRCAQRSKTLRQVGIRAPTAGVEGRLKFMFQSFLYTSICKYRDHPKKKRFTKNFCSTDPWATLLLSGSRILSE